MMAVRAGAEHVYTCEVNANKADLAREIIAANGMADKITVLNAYSLDLDRERAAASVSAALSAVR